MSKLTSLIQTVEYFKGNPVELSQPLPWGKQRLLEQLELCLTSDIKGWHESKLSWIQAADCPALTDLCKNVAECLLSAHSKSRMLREVLRGHRIPQKGVTDRLILSWVFLDIQNAFRAFEVMSTHPELGEYHIRTMVLRYLGQAYKLMLLLGRMLFAPGSDATFFMESWTYLNDQELVDFEFDRPQDYRRIEDPTLAGVLADAAAMPEQYLPANPEPPVYCRNPGPYGPTILINNLGICESTKPIPTCPTLTTRNRWNCLGHRKREA